MVVVVAQLGGCSYVNVLNTANVDERAILTAVENCANVENQNTKMVLDKIAITDNAHEYVENLYRSLLSGNPSSEALAAKETVNQVVSGAAQPNILIGLVAGQTLTQQDILAMDKDLSNAISAARNEIKDCGTFLTQAKNRYANTIGMDASGRLSSFPNGQFASMAGLPHELPLTAKIRPERDIDGDGRITVLDFTPPVVPDVREKWNSGEDTPGGFIGN